MTYLFYAIAAVMIAVALFLVVRPLLQRGRRDGQPRGIFALALSVAFVLPLAAIGLYALVGTPVALDPAVRETPQMTIQQAVTALQQRLQQSPDDVEGWMLLGQTYDVMQQPQQSRDAYGRALKLAPDNVDVMVAWAQADSLARADHKITGQARDLLQKAVAAQPRNQRALWLLGISDYQAGHFADAALTWRRLQVLLQPGSKVANAVVGQIAMANARAAGKSQAEAEALLQPAAATSTATAADAATPRLRVDISLAPALAGKVAAGDTVFVFARADGGSPMPLAVTRLDAAKLPATVILTDGMGMTPAMNLSSAQKVVITARVSKSGQALPQPGDLEGSSAALDVRTRTPVAIVIDHAR
jgi:cytochrome c-type biogenesis protein CcmH